MKSSIRDKTGGKLHEAKGNAKKMAGKRTGNAKLAATGRSQIDSRQGSVRHYSDKDSFGFLVSAHHTSVCPWPHCCCGAIHNDPISRRHDLFEGNELKNSGNNKRRS
jgi:uncharacterized protein YjbJ (UPF0337 family)